MVSRANHRRLAWLALFALWLQLGLSFAHTHPEDFFGLGAGSGHAAQLTADRHTIPGSPASPFSDGLAHDACAICATMALAGSLVLPAPVQIASPGVGVGAAVPLHDAFVLIGASHLLFQTRAPPIV
jgi:hypothetical protein